MDNAAPTDRVPAVAGPEPPPPNDSERMIADLARAVRKLGGEAAAFRRNGYGKAVALDVVVSAAHDPQPTGGDPHRTPMSDPRQVRAAVGAHIHKAREHVTAALAALGYQWAPEGRRTDERS